MPASPSWKADAGSVPCSATNPQKPNLHRLGFFLFEIVTVAQMFGTQQ